MSYIQWIRRQVGRRRIFLPFATVVAQDSSGRVLLQRRSDFDWWGLPGGGLELDEDILGCARRELREETGLSVGSLRLVGVYSGPAYDVIYPNGDEVQQYTICFAGRVNGGRMRADGQESVDQRFFAPAKIPWSNMPVWYVAMLRDALAGGPPVFEPPDCRPERICDQIAAVRPLIGRDWYIGVGAAAAVVRSDGRILAVQRVDNHHWSIPSGFCDLGENVAHTAVRETREETGLDITLVRILGVFSGRRFHHVYPNGDRVKNVTTVFLAYPAESNEEALMTESRLLDQENVAVEWLSPAELIADNHDQPFGYLFKQVAQHLNRGYFIC